MTVVCVLTVLATRRSLISLRLLVPPYSLRYNNIEIRPINDLTIASKWSSERKSHISLTLTEKLDMVKLTGEGRLKAKTESKLGLLHQTVSQCECRKKVPAGKLKVLLW